VALRRVDKGLQSGSSWHIRCAFLAGLSGPAIFLFTPRGTDWPVLSALMRLLRAPPIFHTGRPMDAARQSQASSLDSPRAVRLRRALRLPWPLPAVLAWAGAWTAFMLISPHSQVAAALAGLAIGGAAALALRRLWRGALAAVGFPLSALVLGAAGAWPAWVWLLPLTLLLLIYPVRAWRDAPLFPTPAAALDGLAMLALPGGARVLDAGCGTGAGLRALRRAFPQARIEGIEWSWPLAALAALRCRFARVRRGDLWRADWRGCDLVYLFQRPESMPRALAKARAELRPDAWLVSLEFESVGTAAHSVLRTPDGRPLWVYRPGTGSTAARPGR